MEGVEVESLESSMTSTVVSVFRINSMTSPLPSNSSNPSTMPSTTPSKSSSLTAVSPEHKEER